MKTRYTNIIAIGWIAVSTPAFGYDYATRFNLGVYSIKEDVKLVDGTYTDNDRFIGIGRGFVDLSNLGDNRLEFTVDVRNQYDPFGRVEPKLGRMAASNDAQLRQLVLKSPPASGKVFWSVGRFTVADAQILGNDGAEAGLKLIPGLRMAVFGGLYPEHRGGRSLKLGIEERQFGTYAVFDENSKSGENNTFASTSLVVRKAADGVGSYENPAVKRGGSILVGNETAPPTEGAVPNYLFWYTNAFRQKENGQRLTYISHVIVQPAFQVRNLWASIFQPVTPKVSATGSLFHLDLNGYQQFRDLLDRLPLSGYSQIGGDVRWKLNSQFALVGDTSYGVRDADKKSQTGLGGRMVASGLLRSKVSAFAGLGYRRNFLSTDITTRAGATYYWQDSSVSGSFQYTSQSIVNRSPLHPMIVDLDVGTMFNRNLMGSLVLEAARDEQASVYSALLSIGYRLNNRQSTPIRDETPRLERIL